MIPSYRLQHEVKPDVHSQPADYLPDGRSRLSQESSRETASTPNGPAMSTRRRLREPTADLADADGAPAMKKIKLESKASAPVFKTNASAAAVSKPVPAAQSQRIAERSRDELKQAIVLAASNGRTRMLQRLCTEADSAHIKWEAADMCDFFDAAVRVPKAYPENWGNYTRGCAAMAYLSKRYPHCFDASVYSRPLSTAVKSNNWEEAAELLGVYAASANSANAHGTSLLMVAALSGRLEMYELLRFHDASPHAIDRNGNSVLHYAAQGGNEAIVRDLVTKCKVAVNVRNNDGIAPHNLTRGPRADQLNRVIAVRSYEASATV